MQLTPTLAHTVCERITTSLKSAASQVVFDEASASPVPRLVSDAVRHGSFDLVESSREMAVHLNEIQTGSNSAGLLIVAEATLGDARAVVILKLEKDTGARVQPITRDGKMVLELQLVDGMTLSKQARVYKVGVFYIDDDPTDTLAGLVSDKQRSLSHKQEVAAFFLRRFLGCTPRVAPAVTTRSFFLATQEFINRDIDDSFDKGKYQLALLSELNSNSLSIDPRAFAHHHMSSTHADAYMAFLQEEAVPTTSFDKDVSSIKSQLKRAQLDFDTGVTVLAPPDVPQQALDMRDLPDGLTHLEIVGRVEHVRGRG
jgi:hypothetical protein